MRNIFYLSPNHTYSMLELRTSKEVNDLFTYIETIKPGLHTELTNIKKQFLKHTTFKQDDQLEDILDKLQNELTIMEEKKYELMFKLASYRKDSAHELGNAYKKLKIKDAIKSRFVPDENETNFHDKILGVDEDIINSKKYKFEGLEKEIDETNVIIGKVANLLEKEVLVKDCIDIDCYEMAEKYFIMKNNE